MLTEFSYFSSLAQLSARIIGHGHFLPHNSKSLLSVYSTTRLRRPVIIIKVISMRLELNHCYFLILHSLGSDLWTVEKLCVFA
jgi:hypothetical protein